MEPSLRDNPLLRRAVENLYVQIAFHVAGGTGLGLFLSLWLRQEVSLVMGVMLLGAAVLGHWYAVWSDPGNRRRQMEDNTALSSARLPDRQARSE